MIESLYCPSYHIDRQLEASSSLSSWKSIAFPERPQQFAPLFLVQWQFLFAYKCMIDGQCLFTIGMVVSCYCCVRTWTIELLSWACHLTKYCKPWSIWTCIKGWARFEPITCWMMFTFMIGTCIILIYIFYMVNTCLNIWSGYTFFWISMKQKELALNLMV